jgi:hypothetical protein
MLVTLQPHQHREVGWRTGDHQVRPITIHTARYLSHEACKISSSTGTERPEHHHLKALKSAWLTCSTCLAVSCWEFLDLETGAGLGV